VLQFSVQALAVEDELDLLFCSTLHGMYLLTMISRQLQVHDIAMCRHAVPLLPHTGSAL
jgi:hypothetical protein